MITLCHSDIAQAIMSLNRFCQSPHIGHVECLIHIIGYICHFPPAAICFRTGIPDHETIFGDTPIIHEWMHTIYGNMTEDIPPDMPTPKGRPIRLTTFVNANLMHYLVTSHSCSGILHFLNQTPIDWFTKRQKQVKTVPMDLNSWLPIRPLSRSWIYITCSECLGSLLMGHPGYSVITAVWLPVPLGHILPWGNTGMLFHTTAAMRLLRLVLSALNTFPANKTQLII